MRLYVRNKCNGMAQTKVLVVLLFDKNRQKAELEGTGWIRKVQIRGTVKGHGWDGLEETQWLWILELEQRGRRNRDKDLWMEWKWTWRWLVNEKRRQMLGMEHKRQSYAWTGLSEKKSCKTGENKKEPREDLKVEWGRNGCCNWRRVQLTW